MKCSKCGNIIKESDLYCDNCGEMNGIDNKNNKKKIVLILLCEFVLLAILGGLYAFFVNHHMEKLDLNNFKKVLNSKNYVVQDETKDYKKTGYIDKYYFSENNDKTISFNYVLSTNKSNYMFKTLKSQAESNSKNGFSKTISIDLLNFYNYYSIENNEKYYVVIKTDNTLFASEGALNHKKEIQNIVNDLHLTYPKEINYLLLSYILLTSIIYIIVMWKIFVKAGRKGWQSLIPIYDCYCMSDIVFKKGWYFIFMIITPINIVFIPIWLYKCAKAFGKSTAFAICNILFPYITMQIIAFGSAEYIHKKQTDDNKIDDELIKYKNTSINEDSNFISSEKQTIENSDEIYTKITKIQNRNSILFCIGIFLYFLAFSWTMLYSNVEEEQYALLFIPMLILILIATSLLIFCKITNSKEGKIKYKYKNEKIYYFTILMFAISLFISFDGLTAFKINFETEAAIWFIVIGLAVSSLIYYFKSSSKSKTKLKKSVKIITTILMLIIGFLSSFIVSDDSEELDITNEYSKSSLVMYDKESTPFLLSKSDKYWFFAINEIGSSKMELSIGSKPEELNIFYDIDNAAIRSLAGNDKIVVWSLETQNKLSFFYYNIEENTNYELMKIEGSVENQNPRIELYNEKIYMNI